METFLNSIRTYATNAHGSQMRKYTPELYIVHPVRVMETCKRYTNDPCILSAALLHDVLEDTHVTAEEMKAYLLTLMNAVMADRTLKLVVDLTDVYVKTKFPNLNRRSRKNKELERLEKTSPDSQTIKYADIIDNTTEIVKHDPDFARVYLYECRANLKKLNKGNSQLYNEAVNEVNANIGLLNRKNGN